jgi:signal transduction histidine kinase
MLHEFVAANRDAILARTEARTRIPTRPSPSTSELVNGATVFLTQLSETLRLAATTTPFSSAAIAATAARHGGNLLSLGFNVSQVVHAYGDICQAITELALEQQTPIDTQEFRILNHCLDMAIAEAVTEHARVTNEKTGAAEAERLGQIAHELRNLLSTALLAFQTVKQGAVSIDGSTGMVLGRSLMGLRDVIDSTLSAVRLDAGKDRREQLVLADFLDEVAAGANLHAEYRAVHLSVEAAPRELRVHADRQTLASAVLNLLTNACKYTRTGGHVMLRAHQEQGQAIIEVEDECGGIPHCNGDPFRAFGERRGQDRTGLGLGLSITRKVVKAHGGDIRIRNMPGRGCVFIIEIPLATGAAALAPASE